MSHPKPIEINRAMDSVQARMPELGPDLRRHQEVLQDALTEELGLSPLPERTKQCIYGTSLDLEGQEAQTAVLMNKAERHLLLRYFTEEQHTHLITGEGHEARFIQKMPRTVGDPREVFQAETGFLYRGARNRVVYNTPWYAEACERYEKLGLLPSILAHEIMDQFLGDATRDLDFSLTGGAMGSAIPELAFLLRKYPETVPASERVKAAHDLSHLVLRRASHGFEVNMITMGLDNLQGDIVKLDTPSLYVYRHVPEQKPDETDDAYALRKAKAAASHNLTFAKGMFADTVNEMYGDFMAPTLKCPSHHSTPQKKVSVLNHQVHAGIALGDQVGLFGEFR